MMTKEYEDEEDEDQDEDEDEDEDEEEEENTSFVVQSHSNSSFRLFLSSLEKESF